MMLKTQLEIIIVATGEPFNKTFTNLKLWPVKGFKQNVSLVVQDALHPPLQNTVCGIKSWTDRGR